MNKTIRELFTRAGGTIEVCDVTRDEVLTYSENVDPEKFAEMVVRQCIFELVHESTLTSNKEVQDFTVEVANRIKKRFGLK